MPRHTRWMHLAAGSAIAMALLSSACSDSRSGVTAPALRRSQDKSPSRGSTGFAVLANAAATCTNGTITGDVGTFQAAPTGSVILTSCPVTGAVDVGNAAAITAYNDFLASYAALAPQPGDACTVLTGTLAGVTLTPGVYCFGAAAALTGVLTLKGSSNAIWIFKVGTSGTGALTGTNFAVNMLGGQSCNVTWWVAQAATMTTSNFIGTILASAGITVTGGTFAGNTYAGASGVGDVTITGAAVAGCAGGGGGGPQRQKCNQGVGNGPEFCDPGNSNNHNGSNDETGGTPGNPGRKP